MPFHQVRLCESKISQLDNLNINESFGSPDEDKNFWHSLKFKSKATEKSSNDEIIISNNNDMIKDDDEPNNNNNDNNIIRKTNNNPSRNSETDEEEKSPISMIKMLNGNLQKTMQKKTRVTNFDKK